MLHEGESHHYEPHASHERIRHMANQIAIFFESQPAEAGATGVAAHINDFWEPRMRRHLFEMIDAGAEGFRPLVLQAAPRIRRPA
jgi:formate dehydrogenase subunit delta